MSPFRTILFIPVAPLALALVVLVLLGGRGWAGGLGLAYVIWLYCAGQVVYDELGDDDEHEAFERAFAVWAVVWAVLGLALTGIRLLAAVLAPEAVALALAQMGLGVVLGVVAVSLALGGTVIYVKIRFAMTAIGYVMRGLQELEGRDPEDVTTWAVVKAYAFAPIAIVLAQSRFQEVLESEGNAAPGSA